MHEPFVGLHKFEILIYSYGAMPALCIGHLTLLKESLEWLEMLQAGSVGALLAIETKSIPTAL